jgi:formylmethanofuran dehydrogenase subunit A
MNDKKHNGWSNYATWRVNLEIIDGLEVETKMSAEDIKEFIEDVVFNNYNGTGNRLMYDYASAFISEVNFYEIAENINEELKLQAEHDN